MRTRGKSEDGGRGSDSEILPVKVEGNSKSGTTEEKSGDSAVLHSERKGRSRAGSIDCSISSDNSDTKNKKKKRGREGLFDGNEIPGDTGVQNEDFRLFEVCFPKEFEPDFSTAVFELGLKHSSPKVLMSLMPLFTNLHSEHLKSHLQKYRIHHERSKDEFLAFYNEFMRDDFLAWEDGKGWETRPAKKGNTLSLLDIDISLANTVPLLEITNAATSIQNADNMAGNIGSSSSPSPFNRQGPQVQSPTAAGGPKKPKSLAGYKNIVTQASQLYAEWKMLYDESMHDVSRLGSGNFGQPPLDFDQESKFPRMMKGRQNMGMAGDANGWTMSDSALSSMNNDGMHNYMLNAHLVPQNPNFGPITGDLSSNMMYFGGGASLPMLPLHSNPYGGYSNNYSHSSSYPPTSLSLSLSPQQQQNLHGMSSNALSSLNSLNNPKNLNNLNNYLIPPLDNFGSIALSGGHYHPHVPSLARVSSGDGSEDTTDISSNGSNSNTNDSLLIDSINGNLPNTNNPYFYTIKEV